MPVKPFFVRIAKNTCATVKVSVFIAAATQSRWIAPFKPASVAYFRGIGASNMSDLRAFESL